MWGWELHVRDTGHHQVQPGQEKLGLPILQTGQYHPLQVIREGTSYFSTLRGNHKEIKSHAKSLYTAKIQAFRSVKQT